MAAHLYWLAIALLPGVYCHNSVKGQLLASAPLKPNLHQISRCEHHAALCHETQRGPATHLLQYE